MEENRRIRTYIIRSSNVEGVFTEGFPGTSGELIRGFTVRDTKRYRLWGVPPTKLNEGRG